MASPLRGAGAAAAVTSRFSHEAPGHLLLPALTSAILALSAGVLVGAARSPLCRTERIMGRGSR